ncbi:hypothetical protein CRUP_016209 [Coryphaenoides rupestris]|nr:hypothetical protein CRUP_016209 [Coryphaenoides rupestris]
MGHRPCQTIASPCQRNKCSPSSQACCWPSSGIWATNDNTIATACNIVRSLLTADSNLSKKALTPELVTSLADLSENT